MQNKFWDVFGAGIIAVVTMCGLYFMLTWEPTDVKQLNAEKARYTEAIATIEQLQLELDEQKQRVSKVYDYIFAEIEQPVPDIVTEVEEPSPNNDVVDELF